MNAEHLSLASVTPQRPLSRESAARIAGHMVMAWRYDRLPASAEARLTRHYKHAVVDGWLESGDLASNLDLWMNLRILVAGDVALRALCADALLPHFPGAGLLAELDLDDDAAAAEAFNVRWHAADAEEMMAGPVLRTALLQLFDALRREPALTAAEVKNLLDWEELKARYAREGATSSLDEAVSATVDGWPLRRPAVQQDQRDAAE